MVFTVPAAGTFFKCHSPLITRHLLTIHIGIIFCLLLIALFTHALLSTRAFLFKGETEFDVKRANGLRYTFSFECFGVCFLEYKGFSAVIHWPLFPPLPPICGSSVVRRLVRLLDDERSPRRKARANTGQHEDRVYQEESAIPRENVPWVKLHIYV
jgi:hypothetical protein